MDELRASTETNDTDGDDMNLISKARLWKRGVGRPLHLLPPPPPAQPFYLVFDFSSSADSVSGRSQTAS